MAHPAGHPIVAAVRPNASAPSRARPAGRARARDLERDPTVRSARIAKTDGGRVEPRLPARGPRGRLPVRRGRPIRVRTPGTHGSQRQPVTAVDTATIERRPLRFETIDDLLAEVGRIVAADRAGTLRRTGNWTAGQVFGHLAAWIDYAYEGYPMRVPWFIRFLIRRKLRKYLRDGMPAGVRIPNVAAGTFATDLLPTDEGAERLRRALARLGSREPAVHESPAFGPLSHEDRIALNLRHAELHLGFLHPD